VKSEPTVRDGRSESVAASNAENTPLAVLCFIGIDLLDVKASG
jgi:hypothetical protein